MTEQYRYRRPEPTRTGPRRTFVFRNNNLGPGSMSAAAPEAAGGIDGVIAGAVDLGYRVIEQQMQQGQQAARRLRQGSYASSGAAESDIKALVAALSRVTKGAIDAWVELLGASERAATSWARSADCGYLPIEVDSARPVQVTLDLCPPSATFIPVMPDLRGETSDKKPLTDVRFNVSPDGQRAVLVIKVPDDVAPGVYTGVVRDSATKESGGTISVRVGS